MPDNNKAPRNHHSASRCTPVHFQDVALHINGLELIHKFSCTLKPTGKTVVLGPNGAGKSLFLRLMAGLLIPARGTITRSNKQMDPLAGSMALVFQNPVMLRRSAFENLAFVLTRKHGSKSDVTDRINGALRAAKLEHVAQRPARRLSGGEQQRLALTRALITNPHTLLLDEPTASLDPLSTSIVEDMIVAADHEGTKVVLVTHDIKQAKRMADDILFIHEGRVLAHTSKPDFFNEPGSNEAQAYLDGRVPEQERKPNIGQTDSNGN